MISITILAYRVFAVVITLLQQMQPSRKRRMRLPLGSSMMEHREQENIEPDHSTPYGDRCSFRFPIAIYQTASPNAVEDRNKQVFQSMYHKLKSLISHQNQLIMVAIERANLGIRVAHSEPNPSFFFHPFCYHHNCKSKIVSLTLTIQISLVPFSSSNLDDTLQHDRSQVPTPTRRM